MTDVIRAEGLSKRYQLGARLDRQATFREAMVSAARRAAGAVLLRRAAAAGASEFWALRDVSFGVAEGERLGIIGRNGAGKSTLLKILSRVTPPTLGRVRIRGRVASLLEVGTGFHPELSGRENIHLNGAILGMTRREIRRKFDEIVAFAEVERFLDTPVKRYSSGMYVRLAFAVAAHLDSDILVVDEVLAVGDVEFQNKCLGRMERVSREGRTVLFVSHNMASLLALTSRCILLAAGRIARDGPSSEVIARYQQGLADSTEGRTDLTGAEHYGSGRGRFTSIRLRALQDGHDLSFPTTGCDLDVEADIVSATGFPPANVALTLYDDLGIRIVDAHLASRGEALCLPAGGKATVSFSLRRLLLNGGRYTAGLWLGIANQEDMDGVRYATSFRMEHRREDVRHAPPHPGLYVCDYVCRKVVHPPGGEP